MGSVVGFGKEARPSYTLNPKYPHISPIDPPYPSLGDTIKQVQASHVRFSKMPLLRLEALSPEKRLQPSLFRV